MSWPHRWPVRVYFEDTDAGGIAYHASYLRWAERGRTESLRAINLPHQVMIERHSSMLVVRRIEVEYVAPARLDDSLFVETAVRRFGGASVDLAQDIRDEAGGYKARLRVGLVCVRAGDMRPGPVPGPWREAFRLAAQAASG
ncbi:YbgC/FadM family acyl-CoA thioesterase [Pseudoroseomonas cervicalis]|uniref:YbgC/FadM family acyl-CoA thioesterase n=1 Tax=Teichococcus cervicalis TaxID=204525 RepID=UPI0022F1B622|nr:YbgC/FadM family acyl-CoA thioesterase [Pseudoroseomonas cervicalis]WBV41912.1 YbgC/FadM family acyl-CoA thioesterase [Pseudoroseomonas cervicalis]